MKKYFINKANLSIKPYYIKFYREKYHEYYESALYYYDTNNGFSLNRLHDIMRGKKLSDEELKILETLDWTGYNYHLPDMSEIAFQIKIHNKIDDLIN